uniref:Ulp1 protease family, C-terminal catalytic domain-containing protein n=1 Tax=Tanacetum cinerariifolium TaxID=118510 RepID=A0A6L2NPR3_TANCI|nr:ulp1 protease family, C-terminal catalytic domain-containing protein [Tanacetum cinerariifolium]
MKELRRSGRVKSKGLVVEENTVSDAYFIDDESSGDDFVDGFGKGVEMVKQIPDAWSCRLETEGRKHNTLLGRLRKKYDATLLLLECNMHRDSVRTQLDVIEVADVPVKRMKLPMGGK